jgi:histidine ammonia-lyase
VTIPAAQAFDLLTAARPLGAGLGTRAAYAVIRRHVPRLAAERDLKRDTEAVGAVLRSGEIIAAVEAAVGELKG